MTLFRYTLILALLAGCAAPASRHPAAAPQRIDFTTLAAAKAQAPERQDRPRTAATATVDTGVRKGVIGCVVFSANEWRSPENPRGWSPYWLHKDGLTVNAPDYPQRFRANLLAHRDWVIAFCKRNKVNRVIAWDVEGSELDHWESIVGDPRILPPEMSWQDLPADSTWQQRAWTETTCDLYFKGFREAGIFVGGAIRPTVLRAIPHGRNKLRGESAAVGWQQAYTADPQAVVSGKLGYAVFKLGWTEVYFDSSVEAWAWIKPGNPEPFPPSFYTPFLTHYPNVVLHPEFGPRGGALPRNVQTWANWAKGQPMPNTTAIGISPYGCDASDPDTRAALVAAAKSGKDFMVAADQPPAEANVAAQCAAWREGAGQ